MFLTARELTSRKHKAASVRAREAFDRQWNSSILSRIKNSWWNAKRFYVTNGLKARKPATTSVLNARCSIGLRNTDPLGAKEDTVKQNWP
jgi:hypothetical protein